MVVQFGITEVSVIVKDKVVYIQINIEMVLYILSHRLRMCTQCIYGVVEMQFATHLLICYLIFF